MLHRHVCLIGVDSSKIPHVASETGFGTPAQQSGNAKDDWEGSGQHDIRDGSTIDVCSWKVLVGYLFFLDLELIPDFLLNRVQTCNHGSKDW